MFEIVKKEKKKREYNKKVDILSIWKIGFFIYLIPKDMHENVLDDQDKESGGEEDYDSYDSYDEEIDTFI